ncbi:MAG: hypothetical protein JWM98_373 [Thermoleophilia bacterium]|nr:hypothetical protein [Thermoleophilia bacterium]
MFVRLLSGLVLGLLMMRPRPTPSTTAPTTTPPDLPPGAGDGDGVPPVDGPVIEPGPDGPPTTGPHVPTIPRPTFPHRPTTPHLPSVPPTPPPGYEGAWPPGSSVDGPDAPPTGPPGVDDWPSTDGGGSIIDRIREALRELRTIDPKVARMAMRDDSGFANGG